jgi:uncharacterized membrane-anchored protein
MDYIAHISTQFIGTGKSDDPYRPQVADAYRCSVVDVTGTPSREIMPTPNSYVVEVIADEATMAAIVADERYPVWWVEPIEEASDVDAKTA